MRSLRGPVTASRRHHDLPPRWGRTARCLGGSGPSSSNGPAREVAREQRREPRRRVLVRTRGARPTGRPPCFALRRTSGILLMKLQTVSSRRLRSATVRVSVPEVWATAKPCSAKRWKARSSSREATARYGLRHDKTQPPPNLTTRSPRAERAPRRTPAPLEVAVCCRSDTAVCSTSLARRARVRVFSYPSACVRMNALRREAHR